MQHPFHNQFPPNILDWVYLLIVLEHDVNAEFVQ